MPEDIVLFGETNFRNQKTKFGIKTDDRRRHMYVIGKTGMGKTTLLENMVAQDIQTGKGVAVVDPHGEFAEKMLDYVPSWRVNDVVYFNAADLDYPIAFNVMEKVAPEYRHIMSDGLVEVFRKLWAESWGPRLEYVLRNAILTLLESDDSTLLGIMRILVDKEYRKVMVEKLSDPVVKSFWLNEFARYNQQFQVEAISPIQNKVGQFLTSSLIRNIVGQTKTAIDLRDVMDNQKILIMNLSKGRVGEGSSRLLGAMMITKLQLAAMSRVDIPEEERKDFYLYVDEFQNFATLSFINILSEARKYRLNLTLAHQYIEQLEEEVAAAVLGNVGTIISFRIGGTDAELMEKEFEPEFMINDFVNLGKYNIYLKLMIDGVASKAFSAATLPPPPKPGVSNRDAIISMTRERYATPRQVIEEQVLKWSMAVYESQQTQDKEGKGDGAPRGGVPQRPIFEAECWACAKKIQVPFEPDGVRPVYCTDCLGEIRAGKREPVAARRQAAGPVPSPSTSLGVNSAERRAAEDRRTHGVSSVSVVRSAVTPAISLAEALSKYPAPVPSPSTSLGVNSAEGPQEPQRGAHSGEGSANVSRDERRRSARERKGPDISGLREILKEALHETDVEDPSISEKE